jgi:eukaryotic-like serine/threonine-protein kinase
VIGETVGSYTVTEKISVGGMGTVYKAEHALIGKPAAVKVLHPELCNNREIINRFFNEAKATTTIKHPGIVEIFDFGYMASGDAYIVMEFLEGMSLAHRLKDAGKMPEGEAAIILRSVCNALAAAHAKKIVHRDLKPDNIYMVADPEAPTGERPKILDFGIAKLADASMQGPTTVTKTGAVMGTPTYMSPEQCKGSADIDERSDFYSIGCIYYELVTGRTPFTDMSAGELIGAHLYIEPVKPSVVEPSISAQAEALIMELLAKDPAKRPQTARDLALRFAEIAKNHGWSSQTNPTALRAPVRPSGALGAGGETAPTLASDHSLPPPLTVKHAPEPTTLSGAASQSQAHDIPRRRTGLFVGLGVGVVMAGAVAFLAVTKLGGKREPTPAARPAAPAAMERPTPVEVAPTPTPTPTPMPTPVATPPVPTPAPAPPVEAVKPETVKPETPEPETPKPAPKPVKTATVKKPATKPATPTMATKPATMTKPATETKPAPKPGTTQGSGKILIETDL